MEDVFVPKYNPNQPGLTVGLLLNKVPTQGQVGLEIEVEGKHLPTSPTKFWTVTEDHSLRGDEKWEYVLKKPLNFEVVPEALDQLWEMFKDKGSVFDDSNRTSVHVHLNCQEFYLNRLAAFCGIYFALEDALTHWCGDHRVGNLFCLRGQDAPAIVTQIKKFIRSDGQHNIHEMLHYSGLNANALKKYGSLEVRTLRFSPDVQVIKDWVNILKRIYDISAEFSDPREVCTMLSGGGGAVVFFEEILGPMASIVRAGIPFTEDQLRDSVYNGIRMSQDICYCRDWDKYKPVTMKPDPFNRSLKKVAQKMVEPVATGYDPFGGGINYFEPSPVPPIEEEDDYYEDEEAYEPEEYPDEDDGINLQW